MLFNLRLFMCFVILYGLLHTSPSFAKLWGVTDKQIVPPKPSCTQVGAISCDEGFIPTCPSGHTPSCIFVGTKQLPACLENNDDQMAFNYYLDKISCQKSSGKKKQ